MICYCMITNYRKWQVHMRVLQRGLGRDTGKEVCRRRCLEYRSRNESQKHSSLDHWGLSWKMWKIVRYKINKCRTSFLQILVCREPVWGTPPMAKVMRKEAQHTQKQDRASGVPLDILEHLPPKTRVCLLYCFGLSPLTLLGAVPHHHLALSDKELTYSSS